jgi:hypothetical protein
VTEAPKLIVPRRNFLIRALGFTAAGATLPISIITADDAKARMDHHQAELERAWRDYYGPAMDVRTVHDAVPVGTVSPASVGSDGRQFGASYRLSMFMICSGGSHLPA